MQCQSKFKVVRPHPAGIEGAVYAGMAEITAASNVKVINRGSDWVVVGYDWPADAPFTKDTDETMRPFGLELVKGWKEPPQQPLG